MAIETRKCSKCGKELSPVDDFCSRCGTRYQASQTAPATAEPPVVPTPGYYTPTPPPVNKRSTAPIIMIVLVVIACLVLTCIAVIVGFFILPDNKPTAIAITTEQFSIQEVTATLIAIPPTFTAVPPTPKPTQKPTTIPTQTAIPDPGPAVVNVIGNPFFDDFSTNKDWYYADDKTHVMRIENNAYAISVLEAEKIWLAFVPVDFQITHLEFEVSVAPGYNQSKNMGSYGAACRVREGLQSYYRAEIDPLYKQYSIAGKINGEWTTLTEPEWVDSISINSPDKVNKILFVCQGDLLALYINDVLMEEIYDSSIPAAEGDNMAIFAATWEEIDAGGFKVLFDNVTAWFPVQ